MCCWRAVEGRATSCELRLRRPDAGRLRSGWHILGVTYHNVGFEPGTTMATSPITKPLQNIETKHIRIIGVPLDLGQSRRGVDMGPSAMRVAGLEAKLEAVGYDVHSGGNVPVI